ncbi:MAG: glycosyltransferase [Flavobacteriales bacterium]|nr:glycosyltransferase [Flavobacteriales bacterium]
MPSTKILFLTTQLPYPPTSGGTVKSWNYVMHLARNYSLSVACLLKDDDEKYEKEFLSSVNLDNYISEPLNTPRSAINLLKSYFSAPCLNVFRNQSNSFNKKIEAASLSADIILVDHYEVFQFVPKNYKGKVIMHTHNAEFMLWQRMADLCNNPFKKIVLSLEASRVKKYEKLLFSQSDLIFSTPSDIDLYKTHGFNTQKHHVTYHLGNDSLLDLPDLNFNETQKAISFMGTLSWEPNIDGLIWFLEQVWPLVIKQEPEVLFYIMGKNPNERIVKACKNDKRIILTGFVKDLDSYLQKTRAYIAPLRFGSGMKVKVLEGLYRGVPSVATPVAAEGLELTNGRDIFIHENAKDFAEACIKLLRNESIWNQFKDNTRKIAAEKYTWKELFKSMDKVMEELT